MLNEALNVLLIEDNPGDARLVKEALSDTQFARWQLTSCQTVTDGVALLGQEGFAAVLLDLTLPDCSGVETIVRVHRAVPKIPIVVLTGLNDEAISRDAVKAGAEDYLVKGLFDGGLLSRSLFYAIERGRLRTELEQARDVALQAAKQTAALKADFLARMSHEIRTPLNAIIGTAELQMLSEMTQEQRQRMGVIESSGELLLTIVDHILDFSKLSAGKLVLENLDFNFHDLIASVIDSFGTNVRPKEIELGFHVDRDIPASLRGDSNRLRQILNNLLSNAIKFTSKGEVWLRAVRVKETASETIISFEVRDTGIGIAPDVQARLFQPFVQADQSTSRRFGGTGLGLVISAQLVEQMGGTLGLESALGKGSNFHFKLPFEKSAPIAQPSASGATYDGDLAPTPQVLDPLHAQRKELRVLVVEDNVTNQALIRQQLDALGYSLRMADDGSRALEILAKERFDVVLMDCELPGLDGYEATAEIRKRGRNGKNLKIIALTAHVGENQRERCLAAGMNGYLSKPIRLQTLADTLDACSSNRSESSSQKHSWFGPTARAQSRSERTSRFA